MTISINGTSGIVNDATDLNYTGTLTGGTGVVNLGSGQVYKDASGNVGIGTSSPAGKLDVLTGVNGAVKLYAKLSGGWSAGEYVDLDFSQQGTTGRTKLRSIANDSSANSFATSLAFHVTNASNVTAEAARIDYSGSLLLGVTAFSQSTNGKRFNGADAMVLESARSSTSLATHQLFYNPNGQVGYIATNGSSTSFVTSSDYRLKEDIAPMTGALAKVALLKPCVYKWKVDGSDGQGFIAHELAEVEAGCVTGEKDAVDAEGNPQYQGIDTSFLVATLTAAIQELKTLVDTQAARITALEAPIV